MGLAEVQRTLARLYTDEALRERFFAAPQEVARELGLDPDDSARLAALAEQEVRDFAAALLRKRLGHVTALLPATAAALGAELEPRFRRHAQRRVPSGAQKHREDAIAFAEGLAAEPALAWVQDLARCEAARLRGEDPRTRLILRLFRYPVATLARQLQAGTPPEKPPHRLTLGVWLRLRPGGPIRHFLWPPDP
ncbi:MAG: hypothetical protein ACK47B_02415 [Armatimonadota bacterium]